MLVNRKLSHRKRVSKKKRENWPFINKTARRTKKSAEIMHLIYNFARKK